MTLFERIEVCAGKLSAGLALVGGVGLILATLVTCVSILLKLAGRLRDSIFGAAAAGDVSSWLRPILGEEELVTYCVGFALFAALPWVMFNRGHIKIDLLEPVFSRRVNLVLNALGDLVLAVIAYLILTRQWFMIFKKTRGSKEPAIDLLLRGEFGQAADLIRSAQVSQILGIPLWPTYIVAEFSVFVFFLVACFCVVRAVRELFCPRHTGSSS